MVKIAPVGIRRFLFWLLLFFFSIPVAARPLTPVELPEVLRPWSQWVLYQQEEKLCPFLHEAESTRLCFWPSPLELALGDRGGTFNQHWRVFRNGLVPLPGEEKHWPLEVKVDGKPAAVVLKESRPHLYLMVGDHTVTGKFSWDTLPPSLPIPAEIGILSLTLKGRTISFPNREDSGVLWFQKGEEGGPTGEENLEIRVHRHIADEVPLILTTHLVLNVAGKSRETFLAAPLPEGFVPMSLESPLPAHLEPDGRLRIQIRAGSWEILLTARHLGPVAAITLPSSTTETALPWAAEEIWVFEAQSELRLVSIEGVEAVDPGQTTLPQEWHPLPAYRFVRGDTIRLVESRRGDSDPAPDQLQLHRDLWLDSNGGGYTLHDTITGTLRRSQRLEMNPPVSLGRVSLGGKDQFITRLPADPNDPKAGVEIRLGNIEVGADSRIEDRRMHLPSIGWNHDFQQVESTLHIPPGWRLFAVWGADYVPQTWLNHWSLLEIFLVLILSLAFFKLWGKRWGILALVTLTLTFPEAGAPQWLWLALLAGEALRRFLPIGGRWVLPIKLYRLGCLILLFLIAIPFSIDHLREAIYPVLERPYQTVAAKSTLEAGVSTERREETAVEPLSPPPTKGAELGFQEQAQVTTQQVLTKEFKGGRQFEQTPGAKVQTGPGLPHWSWDRISLEWSGPVGKEQSLHLFWWSPTFNLILAFLRVSLLVLLILCLLGLPSHFWPRWLRFLPSPTFSLLGFALVMAFGLSRPLYAQGVIPTPELLTELRERLLQPPECFPQCASISRLGIEVDPNFLRLRLEADAEALMAIPLPGSVDDWAPERVSVDGEKFAAVRGSSDGIFWIVLAPGVHQILLEGTLAGWQRVSIPLPLKPYFVEVRRQEGWTLEGLHEDGFAEENLHLTRLETLAVKGERGLQSFPSYSLVERILRLGLVWEVETTVFRFTPLGAAISLEIPLLAGESVTTEGVRVEKGKALVSLAPQTEQFSWRSTLKPTDTILLTAPENDLWTEEWVLEVSPVWHTSVTGIPVIHPPAEEGIWLPKWQPWPGEQVTIQVSRPEGVAGQTVTIDQSQFELRPGLRFTEAKLHLTLRASLGGQHVVTLPAGSLLQSVTIDEKVQPIPEVKGQVTLPVVPGTQQIELQWEMPEGMGVFFRAPAVDLGIPSVNSEVQVSLDNPRWIFLTRGPRLGPAVLFWSLLVVLILISIGLGRVPFTPLKTHHWLLLGLGLTQIPVWQGLFFAGWLLFLGLRARSTELRADLFSLRQIGLVLWTLGAMAVLFVSLHRGLLGVPDMQVMGNNSTFELLRWYQDRTTSLLPRPFVISLPLLCYRVLILAWALWIAFALVGWLKWGWRCFSAGGLWRAFSIVKKT